MDASLPILVLYWHGGPGPMRPAIRHHLQAWEHSAQGHQVYYHNVARGVWAGAGRGQFAVVVLHTTLLCMRWWTNFRKLKQRLDWLRDCPSLKVALPQDEYDHAETLDEWLAELNVDVVASNFGEEFWPHLYPLMHRRAQFMQAMTGYIEEVTARRVAPGLRPAAERPLDVVYRANHLPYWFGSHGQLKHQIASVAAERCAVLGLRCDISTAGKDTIVSDGWFDFLASARAIIGCESGASALDRRGEIQCQVRSLLSRHPEMTFEETSALLPAGWDDQRFFALGPRHLEAVITRTCQVLVEGAYDGVLLAGKHYLAVRRDLGNLDEVLASVRDFALVDRVTEQAYEDVFLSGRHSYRALAQKLEEALSVQPLPAARPWSAWWAGRRLRLDQGMHVAGRGLVKALALVKRYIPRPRHVKSLAGKMQKMLVGKKT